MTPMNSALAHINPSLKLSTHLVIMILLMMTSDPRTTCLLWLLAVSTGIVFGGWRLHYLVKRLLPYLLFFVLTFWMLAAFGKGETLLWQWGWFHITQEGIQHGLTIAMRMYAFVTYSLLFTSTTDVSEFIMSLIHQCHLSPKWAYGLLAGLRFVPLFQSELQQMKAAHKIRGFQRKNWREAFIRYTLPLLTQGIRRAERVAIAMEARGFTGSKTRTYYATPQIKKKDYSYSAILLLFTLIIQLLSWQLHWLTWSWQ
ncbi:putative HMP/thiamine permease protein YkoC [Pullulanibacillus camelliae]|uniref:Putative HMP/thiamine permease protein YkoC n=1 Tax=Pullulanibacillus camelliae TaxID=1707096 RepID=A0A8J2YI28_9BACL|nr:energy-coupling factor transporter transmembrane component T [Pullulanibacillus camelliae]GGE44607.1 putative HMP/thiamine permease protein YkoC [Pullulanibacillus camelliae]